jgi:hypothetical protein
VKAAPFPICAHCTEGGSAPRIPIAGRQISGLSPCEWKFCTKSVCQWQTARNHSASEWNHSEQNWNSDDPDVNQSNHGATKSLTSLTDLEKN